MKQEKEKKTHKLYNFNIFIGRHVLGLLKQRSQPPTI